MYSSPYRQSANYSQQERKMRFSSYQDLSHLLKRKPSAYSQSLSAQKSSAFKRTTYETEQNAPKFSINLKSNDIKLSRNLNPQFFQQTQNKIQNSQTQSRVSSAYQSRSSSSIKRPTSAYRNTSLKIADFSSTLEILQNQLRAARQQINLALKDKQKLSSLMQNELNKIKELQSNNINGLGKKFKVKKQMDLQRRQDLRDNINKLWYSNENLKQNLFQMQQKVEKLQIQMGNHDYL